jgi:hypothetical protein
MILKGGGKSLNTEGEGVGHRVYPWLHKELIKYFFLELITVSLRINNKILIWPVQQSQYRKLLRAGWSGDQILVGVRFSTPTQTGPGAHPASYIMGTRSFPRVKRPGRGVDHPPSSNAEVKKKSRAIQLLSLWAFSELYLYLFMVKY